MELQNYIRNNNDYIRCMRKKNIKVIKAKTLNVALLTYNRRHSDTYDFNNNTEQY